MSNPHPDIGPELRQLAQVILDRLDPAVRAAAAMATEALRGPGRCQQVWCPVCALAALVNGEQHPLLTVIADNSVALLTVIRAMTGDQTAADTSGADASGSDASGPTPGGPDGTADSDSTATPTGTDSTAKPAGSDGRYHDIPIIVETVPAGE
jgi:hypothetical protein